MVCRAVVPELSCNSVLARLIVSAGNLCQDLTTNARTAFLFKFRYVANRILSSVLKRITKTKRRHKDEHSFSRSSCEAKNMDKL